MGNGRVVAFVMAGGPGRRLWPLSRPEVPKPFLDLDGHGNTLGATLDRLMSCPGAIVPIHVVAERRHRALLVPHLTARGLASADCILEPEARSTAAVVAVAALHAIARYRDPLVLVVPADHRIDTPDRFWQAVETGMQAANDDRLVLFGIVPDRPETGFGYVEAAPGGPVRDVSAFHEKPDAVTARAYAAGGRHFWNAGIFLFRASAMRRAFAELRPDILARAGEALDGSKPGESGLDLCAGAYREMPSISFDHAVVERLARVAMVEADFGWRDLGSWRSLRDAATADAQGNVVSGEVSAQDCRDCYLRGEGIEVSVAGLEGVVVVATRDAVLVRPVDETVATARLLERLPSDPGASRPPVRADQDLLAPLRHWLLEVALPRWARDGIDRRDGGFHEALMPDGTPAGLPRRTRTMARQVFAFATAELLGWDGPGSALAQQGLAVLCETARRADGGWVRLPGRSHEKDEPEDLYDTACVMLALAQALRIGAPQAGGLLEGTAARLDGEWHGGGGRSPADGGWRSANAHMHLLEAYLSAAVATGDDAWLERAGRIVRLCTERFVDPVSGTLGERFDAGWTPEAGEAGNRIEPGHHFEWASLLVARARLSGNGKDAALARRLFAWAAAFGIDPWTGLVFTAVDRCGRRLERSSRAWMQAEALKAELLLSGEGGVDRGPAVEARLATLMRLHVEPAPRGLWLDRVEFGGLPAFGPVPASTLYHLVSVLAPAGLPLQ